MPERAAAGDGPAARRAATRLDLPAAGTPSLPRQAGRGTRISALTWAWPLTIRRAESQSHATDNRSAIGATEREILPLCVTDLPRAGDVGPIITRVGSPHLP
ncbi:hypothetical protein GCM10010429_14840 [Micromonospora olivasterospora]